MGNWTGGGQYKKINSTLIVMIIMIDYDFFIIKISQISVLLKIIFTFFRYNNIICISLYQNYANIYAC